MSIFNRRNALLGWATWMVVKQKAKRDARRALPEKERRLIVPAAVTAAAATAAGALLFWRRRARPSGPEEVAE
jgi:hypothetical protein